MLHSRGSFNPNSPNLVHPETDSEQSSGCEDNDASSAYDEDDDDEEEDSNQFYTIPAHSRIPKLPPVPIHGGDYTVFEQNDKKRGKKINPLRRLFNRRDTNAWQETSGDNSRMILKPEEQVISLLGSGNNKSSSNINVESFSGNTQSRSQMAQAQVLTSQLDQGEKLQHIDRKKHRYRDDRGIITEVIQESIITKSTFPRKGKTKAEARYFTNDARDYEKDLTTRLRQQQVEKMQQYASPFVHGMEPKLNKKSKKTKKSTNSVAQLPLTSTGNTLMDSYLELKETASRFGQSLIKQGSQYDNMRNFLVSPRTATEIHRSICDAVYSLPGGGLPAPLLVFLGKLIPNKKSKEGSYMATLVSASSVTIFIIISLIALRIFKFLYRLVVLLLKIAGYFGLKL